MLSPVATGLIILYKTDDNTLNTEPEKTDDASVNNDEKNISHVLLIWVFTTELCTLNRI
jgi:hypothetical protein